MVLDRCFILELGDYMRTHGATHQAMVCIMLAAATLSACTSWQVQNVSPEQVVATQKPSAVRVQLLDGSRVVLDSPRIQGDSLLGATQGRTTGVPLAGVHDLAVRHGSAGKTIGLVLGIAAGGFIILMIAAVSACGSGGCS